MFVGIPDPPGGVTAEWFKAQLAQLAKLFGPCFYYRFDTGYMWQLYYVLMKSIGKTGTHANFNLNIYVMEQLIMDHYVDQICLRDFSKEYISERKNLFGPWFRDSFNKRGV